MTTVTLHGNRMVRSNPHSTEIIDLDQQSITFIDHDKHSYSVMTFQQMKQAMTNAMAKAKEQGASTSAQQPASSDGQMNFDAHVTSNGTTRTIDGLQAKEALVTITMLANARRMMAPMSMEVWLRPVKCGSCPNSPAWMNCAPSTSA